MSYKHTKGKTSKEKDVSIADSVEETDNYPKLPLLAIEQCPIKY